MKIRPVAPEDHISIMDLIVEFTEESLAEYGTYLDPEQLKQSFDGLYKTSFVAVEGDKIVGVLGGRIVEDFCSKEPVYEEVIWYMKKGHRTGGVRLFRCVEDWCGQNNIRRITMCCMHNSKTDKLFELYERMGFKIMETRFIKELG